MLLTDRKTDKQTNKHYRKDNLLDRDNKESENFVLGYSFAWIAVLEIAVSPLARDGQLYSQAS